MDAYLLLGCNGRASSDKFIFCNSVANPVISLSKINKEKREKVISFLDNACSLFDGVCHNYNKCINIINMLFRQFGIISEESLHEIQAFIRMHKTCGIYIMLIMEEDYNVRHKDTNKQ